MTLFLDPKATPKTQAQTSASLASEASLPTRIPFSQPMVEARAILLGTSSVKPPIRYINDKGEQIEYIVGAKGNSNTNEDELYNFVKFYLDQQERLTDRWKAEADKYKKANANCQADLRAANQRIKDLEAELADCRRRNAELEAELADCRTRNAELEAELANRDSFAEGIAVVDDDQRKSKKSNAIWWILGATTLAAGGGYYYYSKNKKAKSP